MTLVIGLTGSIGTGKSMIANEFRSRSIPVIDADIIARKVVEPGEIAYEKIIESFGADILHDDKTLNRPALGEIVFGDEQKRNALNDIIHPEIRKEMREARDRYIQEELPCVVLDIPLLFESKLTHFVDKIIVVSTNEETQKKRLAARDNSTMKDIEQRIASQMPVKEKAAMADAVIDNNGTMEESVKELETILHKWSII